MAYILSPYLTLKGILIVEYPFYFLVATLHCREGLHCHVKKDNSQVTRKVVREKKIHAINNSNKKQVST